VHTSESEQLQLRAHYLYSVTVNEYVEGSLEIVNVKELGRLGQADTEVPLINENLPQLFDYHLEMTERIQTLIDNKKYIRGQFVVREGSGEYVVQVTDQQTLLYVHERYPEHVNRAI
jgi:predicted transport protein